MQIKFSPKTHFLKKHSWFTVLCQFQHSDTVTHTYAHARVCVCMYTQSFFHTLSHHVLSQESGCCSLDCMVGPHHVFILNVNSLHLPTPNPLSIPLPSHPLPLAITSLFSISVSLFLFCRYIQLCNILDSTYKWSHMAFVFLFLIYFT